MSYGQNVLRAEMGTAGPHRRFAFGANCTTLWACRAAAVRFSGSSKWPLVPYAPGFRAEA